MEKYTTYIMVPEDKNINATVVNTYTNSSQSAGNTRTHREMSKDDIKNNIINSIPSCTILNIDSHQKSPVTSCEGQPTQLNIGLESEDSKSKDDIEISENSESDSSGIEEDNNKDFSNTMEDSQSKEYNEKNGQESNCDSDFVTFTDETTSNDALNISKDVFEMTRGSDFDESFLCTNGCMEQFGYCNIHDTRGRPDGCEEKQRKARDVIQEDTVGSGTNVRLADRLYKTCVKRDQSYDTQKIDVGFAINTINEIILDGSSHREDPDGCEEDTRDDSMDVKKQDCSMILEMQFISRKPFNIQIFLWRIDAITLVWIIVKIGIVITATIVSIAKLGIVVTATIVSIVKLEMVVMKLVNEADICTYASQQGQLVSVSEIENPIHTKVNTAILSIESEDYIEYKMEDGEMQEKKVGFAIVDIDNKEVAVEVKKEKDNIESEHASDNGQENEKGIISGQLVFEGQCIEDGNDGRRVIGQMQRMVGDMVGEKVWLKKSLEENESIDEKANGDILEKENDFDDIEAVNHFRKDTNELVYQRVEAIQGKADDVHGEREAAKAREEQIEIDSEKTDKEVDINAKASVKEIQVCEIPNKNVVIGDNKAADEMIGNDDQSDNNRATRETGKQVKEPIGKCKRQQNDFDGEKVGSEIEEEKDQTSGKKAVGEILNANDGGDGEKAACSNSDKDETCGDIGGSGDIIKTQGEEKKENFIPRGQTENIDDRKAVGIKIEDIYHTKTVNETGVEDYLKDNTVFDEQDDKEGTNSHQVERSGSTTGHSIRDLNHFQRIIIVLLICGIPCARGASSELSTKVKWSLQTNPVVFGSNATLCCIMQYPDTDHMAWIRDSGAMIVATGDSPSNRSKYSASMELRGNLTYYLLTIINVDMTDVNVNYKCESDFDLFEQKLELNEDNFVMEPSSKETVTNITRENGMITVSLRMRNMYPKPKCFFSTKKEKINGNVSLEENGKLYNVKMACGIREDLCEYNVTAYCALGKKMVSIDLPTSNNSWTQRCSKDRHGNDSVVIVTVVIIITLLCIVTLVITGLFVKKYFSRKVSYAFQPVLKSEQPVREDV